MSLFPRWFQTSGMVTQNNHNTIITQNDAGHIADTLRYTQTDLSSSTTGGGSGLAIAQLTPNAQKIHQAQQSIFGVGPSTYALWNDTWAEQQRLHDEKQLKQKQEFITFLTKCSGLSESALKPVISVCQNHGIWPEFNSSGFNSVSILKQEFVIELFTAYQKVLFAKKFNQLVEKE